MEVLSEKNWKTWNAECKCDLCESELKFMLSDIKPYALGKFCISCPICEEKLILVTESLPKYVQKMVGRRIGDFQR
jgi:hypothetical protein